MEIDIPKFLEVCIAGDLKFIALVDHEDSIEDFEKALAETCRKSVSAIEIDNPLREFYK